MGGSFFVPWDDLLIALGIGLVALGLWWIYPPAALIWLGLCGLAAGLTLALADALKGR